MSPKVKSLEKVLETTSDVSEGVSGFAKLFLASEDGLSIAEGLTTAGEIMAGATGVAEASTAFGPPGWVVGISTLAIGGTASILMSEPKDSGSGKMDIDPNHWRQFFEDQEKQKDLEKLIDIYNVSNLKQLDDVKKEVNSDFRIEDRKKRVDKLMDDWQKEANEIKRNSFIEFPELKNKWVKPDKLGSDEFVKKWFFPADPLTDDEKLSLGIEDIQKRYEFDARFKHEKADTVKMNREIAEFTHLNKHYNLINPVQEMRLATEREWLLPEYDRRDLTRPPAKDAINKKQNKQSVPGYSLVPFNNNNSRVININLNKPMIEHFTINTKEVKEGLNDFKHKVEEVLLEILNSANAIQ